MYPFSVVNLMLRKQLCNSPRGDDVTTTPFWALAHAKCVMPSSIKKRTLGHKGRPNASADDLEQRTIKPVFSKLASILIIARFSLFSVSDALAKCHTLAPMDDNKHR